MRVSILIPCYNAERWVGQAIESALAQTWRDREVIVVDDGSTDGSLEVITSFGGRIRWETGPNRGGNVARNRLLTLASGEWLQYLDADDYLLPDKIENQMKVLAGDDATDVLFGPVTLEHVNEDGCRLELLPIPEPHDPWILLARWYLPQTGAPLWRKQAIAAVGGWNEEQPVCQEHELYLRLMMGEKRFRYSACNGAVYRQWGEQTLWRRNKPEVRRRRLAIEQSIEDHLREAGELTPERLWAVNMARFETARTAWQEDRAEARAIIRTIRRSDREFMPEGEAAPQRYRLMYRLLGFTATETIADVARAARKGPNRA